MEARWKQTVSNPPQDASIPAQSHCFFLNGVAVVPVGNLRSEILVVQSAQNWHRQRATDSLDSTRDRRVLVQR
jgi:hypothetical protein